jgi:hypothetical protein
MPRFPEVAMSRRILFGRSHYSSLGGTAVRRSLAVGGTISADRTNVSEPITLFTLRSSATHETAQRQSCYQRCRTLWIVSSFYA